jgi:mRNA-degrading endonuclease RelE of RelBE toxin-antitoxin system
MAWQLQIAKSAAKSLQKAPAKDRRYLQAALVEMAESPFSGDVRKLEGMPGVFRRRVGNWRIFFDVNFDGQLVRVSAIERRTSTTY